MTNPSSMKNTSDFFIGFFLILAATITYLVTRNMEFDSDFIFSGGLLGKLRIIVAVLWLLFGNIIGAILGVVVGFWFIFRS